MNIRNENSQFNSPKEESVEDMPEYPLKGD